MKILLLKITLLKILLLKILLLKILLLKIFLLKITFENISHHSEPVEEEKHISSEPGEHHLQRQRQRQRQRCHMRQPNNSEALNSLSNPVDILWMILGSVEESNCVGRLERS